MDARASGEQDLKSGDRPSGAALKEVSMEMTNASWVFEPLCLDYMYMREY